MRCRIKSGASVCWRQLSQTSAAGPKAKPQTGRRNMKETDTGANPTHISSNGEMGRKDPLVDHMVPLKQQFTDNKNRREEKFTRRN